MERRKVLGLGSLTLACLLSLGLGTPSLAESEAGFSIFGGGSESGGFAPVGTDGGSESGGVVGSGAESQSGGVANSGAESESGGLAEVGTESESGGSDASSASEAFPTNQYGIRYYNW
jgi:hypothetical protein